MTGRSVHSLPDSTPIGPPGTCHAAIPAHSTTVLLHRRVPICPKVPLRWGHTSRFQPWNRARHVEQRFLNPAGQGETAPNGRLRASSRQGHACRVPCRQVGQKGSEKHPTAELAPAKEVFSASSNVSKDCLKTHHRTWHDQVRHAARRGSEDRPEAWPQPAPPSCWSTPLGVYPKRLRLRACQAASGRAP